MKVIHTLTAGTIALLIFIQPPKSITDNDRAMEDSEKSCEGYTSLALFIFNVTTWKGAATSKPWNNSFFLHNWCDFYAALKKLPCFLHSWGIRKYLFIMFQIYILREIPVRDDDSGPNGKLLSYRQQMCFIDNDKTSYYQCANSL